MTQDAVMDTCPMAFLAIGFIELPDHCGVRFRAPSFAILIKAYFSSAEVLIR